MGQRMERQIATKSQHFKNSGGHGVGEEFNQEEINNLTGRSMNKSQRGNTGLPKCLQQNVDNIKRTKFQNQVQQSIITSLEFNFTEPILT